MRLVIFEISEDTDRCIQGIAAPRGLQMARAQR